MFLHVSVILFTGGGHAWWGHAWQGACVAGAMYGKGGGQDLSIKGGGGMGGRGHVYREGGHAWQWGVHFIVVISHVHLMCILLCLPR